MSNKATELIDAVNTKIDTKIDFLEIFMNKGATETEVKELEQISGFELPHNLKNLLRLANGEGDKKLMMLGLFFSNIERIIYDLNFFRKTHNYSPDSIYQEGMIKPNLYNPNRIPFATDESGQYLCIDFDPGPKGIYGQIIYLPCAEPEPVSVVAKDFDEFLGFIILSLKNDQLTLYDLREDWDEDDWTYWRVEENADYSKLDDFFFERRWRDDWTDIADLFNLKQLGEKWID